MLWILLAWLTAAPPINAPYPAMAHLNGADDWPRVVARAPDGYPAVVGIHVPTQAGLEPGLWLRAYARGAVEARRVHWVNAATDFDRVDGCPHGGGMAVQCSQSASVVRLPMLALASKDVLWVGWLRREDTHVHVLEKHHKRPSKQTFARTEIVDELIVTQITMSGRQWMQGQARRAKLPSPLADGVVPELVVRDGVPTVVIGDREVPMTEQHRSWNTGALIERSAMPPPPPPPPEPPPKDCRSPHRMDCGRGCTDVRNDRRNCGSCGLDCGRFSCQGGQCGPFCYTDRQCVGKFKAFPRGRCLTPLVHLRGTPTPEPACVKGSCGKWQQCVQGKCQPLKCQTRKDCPSGRVKCLPRGAGKVCVPRGKCVGHFKVPTRPDRRPGAAKPPSIKALPPR